MNIVNHLCANNITFEENVSLRKKTWLKTGGIASLWISPNNVNELRIVLKYLIEHSLNFDIVGYTSNIFFLDTTNPNIIINTKNLTGVKGDSDSIICECGVPVASISKNMVKKGYIGFSGLVNLPGTIGAASVNNSSCFNCSISNLIKRITVFDVTSNTEKVLLPSDLKYSHRTSILKSKELNAVVLEVELNLVKGNVEEEIKKADEATKIRIETQEKPAYTLGSVFANLELRKPLGLCLYMRMLRILADYHLIKNVSRTEILLKYYKYKELQPYVSKLNVNTFIWKPEIVDKEATFNLYCEFMRKAFVNLRLEVEVR